MVRVYDLEIHPKVLKFLAKIRDRALRKKLVDAIEALRSNPRPEGCKKLKDSDGAWRIRIDDYRVIYDIHDSQLVVLVLKIGHRRDIYR